jgi:hypothetical protein
MLLGLAIFWVAKNPALKVFGLVWPVAMFFAVVMTANHFILDTILGAIVSFAGLGIAWLIHRYGREAWEWALGQWRRRSSADAAAPAT